jgi:hypothetical protein
LSIFTAGLYLGCLPGMKFWAGVLLVTGGAIICKLSLKEGEIS